MRERVPLATVQDAVLQFLRGRDDAGFLAPKGPKQISPGQRPGCRGNEVPAALKGRNKERAEALPTLCCALSGLRFWMLS